MPRVPAVRLALILAAAITAAAWSPAHGQAPDDSRAQARSLPAGESRTADVAGDDHDWYVFSAAGSHMVKVSVVNRSECALRGELHVGESVDQAKTQTVEPGQTAVWEFIAYGGSSWYYLDIAASATTCAGAAYDASAVYEPAPAGAGHPAQLQCISSTKAERRARSRLTLLRKRSQAARATTTRRRYRRRITEQRTTVRRAAQQQRRSCN